MFYPKNVPPIERFFRLILGVVLVALLFLGEPIWGSPTPISIGLVLFTAGFLMMTSYVGWCPACALVGRKLKQ